MKICRLITSVMLVAVAVIFAGCSGSDSNGAKTNVQSKNAAKQMSEILSVSSAPDNQLNPQVIYLADKQLYFTVWEDYRNRNTFGADIYGQFINPDGTLCSSPFAIVTAPVNQTVPQVAYRQDKAGVDSKLVVTWQDGKGTGNSGYVSYASVSKLPQFDMQTNTCNGISTLKIDGPFDVGFTPIKTYSDSILPQASKTINITGDNTGGTDVNGSVVLTSYVVPGSISVTGTYPLENFDNTTLGTLSTISVTDDGAGKLSGSGASGTIDYKTGNLSIVLINEVDTGTTAVFNVNYSRLSGDLVDVSKLISRKTPKVSYDSARDEFWLAWIESRDINNIFSTTCWGKPINWWVENGSFAGYLRLNASDLSNVIGTKYIDGIDITYPDLLRNHDTSTARLISSTAAATTITRTYEYFSSINNVSIASDANSPETLFAWEGNRQKGTLTCDLDVATGIITTAFTSSNYDDGVVHIYGLFDKEIILASVNSKWIDWSNKAAGTNPTIAVDDGSAPRKFLVAWEDNRDGANTKIYGQLIYSGLGFLYGNKIISFSDYNGSGVQDPTVANSRQTRPTALFDAVNQRYFVTWQDGRNGATSSGNIDVYGQNLDLDGGNSGGNYAITTGISNQLAPAIAYDTLTKQLLYIWKGGERTTSFSDIYGQLYSVSNSQIAILNSDNTPLSPTLLDFAMPKPVAVGVSAYKSFKVRNTGIAPLTIESISILGTAVFSVTPAITSAKPAILPAGSDLPITVTYTPVDGTSSGSVLIKSDAADVSVDLNGLGVSPVLTPSVSSLVFPANTNVGESQTASFILTNSGTIDVTINSISGLSGSSSFTLANNPVLTFPQTITAGNSLELFVLFAPTQMGDFSGAISILTNMPVTNRTITLSGSGIQSKLSTDLSTDSVTGVTSLGFVTTIIGETTEKAFKIKNSGNKSMTVNSFTISGTSGFSVKTTIKTPLVLVPGESLDIPVLFSPTTKSGYIGTLTIISDGGQATITLSGQGTAPITIPTTTPSSGTSSTDSTNLPPASTGGSSSSGCFIATAAYGSYLDPHVMALRSFRDNVLLQSGIGTEFVEFYYKNSPPIADYIAKYPVLKLATRLVLTPLILAVKYPLFAVLLFSFAGAWFIRNKLVVRAQSCITQRQV